MDTTSLQSTLNKARAQFKKGLAKACVEILDGVLPDLKIEESEWYRLRNDSSVLLARLSSLERDRGHGIISEKNYLLEWNKLFHGTNQLLLDFEQGVKEMAKTENDKGEELSLYPAELGLGLNFKKTDLEEIRRRVLRLENILGVELDLPRRITGTRPGSVIVAMNLYAEEIIKIKSLVKLGLVDDALGFKVLDSRWDWIENENFMLFLEKVNLTDGDLRDAYHSRVGFKVDSNRSINVYHSLLELGIPGFSVLLCVAIFLVYGSPEQRQEFIDKFILLKDVESNPFPFSLIVVLLILIIISMAYFNSQKFKMREKEYERIVQEKTDLQKKVLKKTGL